MIALCWEFLMSFKRIKLLSLLLAAVNLTACSDFLEGKKETPGVIELSNDKLSCLSVLPENILKISDGTASDLQITSSVSCMQDSLTYFQKRTRGALDETYSIPELRGFFGKYFLKENNVSPQLAAELMKLKKALLGGSENYLTKSEITRLNYILKVIQEELLLIRPHIRVLTMQAKKGEVSAYEVKEASAALQGALFRIAEQSELTRSDYSFADAKKLVSGIADFVTGDEPFTLYVRASTYVPLIETVKIILFGEKAELQSKQDWLNAIRSVVSLYGLALRFNYEVKSLDISNSQQVQLMQDLIEQSLDLVLGSPRMVQRGEISFKEIDRLLELLHDEGFINLPVSVRAIQETYRAVVGRMLDPEQRNDLSSIYSLNDTHLRVLKRELEIFRMHQVLFESRLNGVSSWAEYRKALLAIPVEKWIGLQEGLDVSVQTALLKSWRDTLITLSTQPGVVYTNQDRVFVGYGSDRLQVSWKSVTQMNLMRALARFLSLGYGNGNSLNLDRATISEAGLSQWYEDFHTFGVEMKAFDPRSLNSGPRAFKEANFFTFSGNGDKAMDLKETYQFVSFLFSGGMRSSNDLQSKMLAAGCGVPELDVFGFKKFEERCFQKEFFASFGQYFENLPWMVAYVRTLGPQAQREFFEDLMVAARVSEPQGGLVEMADVRTLVMILHYVESVFTGYDKDQDQRLSVAEVKLASDRFVGFLREMRPGTSDSNLRDGFTYLVFSGEMPSTWDVISTKVKDFFGVDRFASRGHILKVIRNLKSSLN